MRLPVWALTDCVDSLPGEREGAGNWRRFIFPFKCKAVALRASRDSSAILGGNGLVTVLARPCNPGFLWLSADFRPKGLSLGSS